MIVRVGGFFSGIGAHHSALDRIKENRPDFDYRVIFQCEIDKRTSQAYDVMHGTTLNLGDITKVENIGGSLAVDILFWTPPCQDISLAGQMAGNDKDSGTRSSLAFEIPRIIEATPERERPRYLVFEEVPMMVSSLFVHNFKAIRKSLEKLGYSNNWGVLNAADYGVAQSRKRCFMVSKLNGAAPRLPKPIPLEKCLRDYLDSEPVPDYYYLSKDRLKGLIYSTEKEKTAGNGFRFEPTDGGGIAHCLMTNVNRKTQNFLIR